MPNVEHVKTYFHTDHSLVKAVNGVSYCINEHEIIIIMGESGCGKSVSQLYVMHLIPTPPGEITEGTSSRLRGRTCWNTSRTALKCALYAAAR